MLNLKKIYLLFALILSCFVFISACVTTETKEKFTVDLRSPQIPIGDIEAQFNTFMSFGGLKKHLVTLIYFPREDAVCLQYRREFTTYHQFWSKSGRQAFIDALVNYNTSYNERTLVPQNRRTIRNFGSVESYLYWQMYKFTVQAKSNVKLELGYQFKDNSPYFSIYQREAEFKEEMTRDLNRNSPAITLYFTRAQAAELAEKFDTAYLRELTSGDIKDSELPDGDRDRY